jgi:hypothetical protein
MNSIKLNSLETFLNELHAETNGITVDGYDDEYFVKRKYGAYTVSITETGTGYELGTLKTEQDDEEISNFKMVKSIKAVNTYLNKFL